jgi:hypothetical protein
MMGPGMFAGVFEGIIVIGLLVALALGVICALPIYYIGKHYGKEAIYEKAVQEQVLEIKYDSKTGEKLYIWKGNK